MPTTSCGSSLMRIDRPTIAGSPPKRRRHNRWLRITTVVAAGLILVVRERAAVGGRNAEQREVVPGRRGRRRSRSGSPSSARLKLVPVSAANSSTEVSALAEVVEVADRPRLPRLPRQVEKASSTRSGSAYAYGFSTTACTTLKIAVVAPMPSAERQHRGEREARLACGTAASAKRRSCRSSSNQSRRAHESLRCRPSCVEHGFDARRSPAASARARAPRPDRCRDRSAPACAARRDARALAHFLFDRHAPQQRSQALADRHD